MRSSRVGPREKSAKSADNMSSELRDTALAVAERPRDGSRGLRTCLAWRLRKREERGVYAASAWDNPRGPTKFRCGRPAQPVKRPEGRVPAALGAGGLN